MVFCLVSLDVKRSSWALVKDQLPELSGLSAGLKAGLELETLVVRYPGWCGGESEKISLLCPLCCLGWRHCSCGLVYSGCCDYKMRVGLRIGESMMREFFLPRVIDRWCCMLSSGMMACTRTVLLTFMIVFRVLRKIRCAFALLYLLMGVCATLGTDVSMTNCVLCLHVYMAELEDGICRCDSSCSMDFLIWGKIGNIAWSSAWDPGVGLRAISLSEGA